MFPLKKHQSATPSVESNAPAKPVLSVESASLIDYAESLKERFGVNVFRQQLEPGLETQQLDNSEKEAMMDRIKSTINDYDNKHPHTGPTHIYLLDGRGMGNADDGVVNALISASIRNPSQTLAALIPENVNYTRPDDLSPSSMLRQLADQVLASEGVRCVVGRKALEAFLDGDEQYVVVGSVGEKKNLNQASEDLTSSTESILGTLALGAGLAIAVTALTSKVKELAKEQREWKDKKVFDENLKKRYLNPTWVKEQSLVSGPIEAHGIADVLGIAKVPALPGQAQAAASSFLAWEKQYTSKVKAFIGFLKEAGKKEIGADDEASLKSLAASIRARENELGLSQLHFQGFGSHLKVVHEHGGNRLKPSIMQVVHQLSPLSHADIPVVAKAIEELLTTARECADASEILKDLSWEIPEAPYADEWDDVDPKKAIAKDVYAVMEAFYSKSFRANYIWVLDDLTSQAAAHATALSAWIDRSLVKKN